MDHKRKEEEKRRKINEELAILKQGVEIWNKWRRDNPTITPTLGWTNLSGMDLTRVDFSRSSLWGTNFHGCELHLANFNGAELWNANLSLCNLDHALFRKANLREALLANSQLTYCDMREADLSMAHLGNANLLGSLVTDATLNNAILDCATLVEVDLSGSDLTGCCVFGVSAWNVKTNSLTNQSSLVISNRRNLEPLKETDPVITVDDLEIAQFVYLMIQNQNIRRIIDTITSKVVLILGRFTPDRKCVIDALREELRKHDYVPVVFDFERPPDRTFMETVSILAHMSRFIIGDFTEPKIILQEAEHIVRNIAVPFVPLLARDTEREPTTLFDLRVNHRSLLDTVYYNDIDDLLTRLGREVIALAEASRMKLHALRIDQ